MDERLITELRSEFVDSSSGMDSLSKSDFCRLVEYGKISGDELRLRRQLRRRQLGEPLEYIIGYQEFRGLRFAVDKRVYITDPEVTHLVDATVEWGQAFLKKKGRAPQLVEFGVGCGSLAISIKRELPEACVIGLDLDPDAIVVARENAASHNVDILLLDSDLFSGLPAGIEPDLIFGDPPWGDDESMYDHNRPAAHYHAMPALSAFPRGGLVSVHEAILADVASRGWSSEVLLNCGILDGKTVDSLGKNTIWHKKLMFDDVSLFHCRMCESL